MRVAATSACCGAAKGNPCREEKGQAGTVRGRRKTSTKRRRKWRHLRSRRRRSRRRSPRTRKRGGDQYRDSKMISNSYLSSESFSWSSLILLATLHAICGSVKMLLLHHPREEPELWQRDRRRSRPGPQRSRAAVATMPAAGASSAGPRSCPAPTPHHFHGDRRRSIIARSQSQI